jgi:NTP pyrophosphatase (non-canonical NTP hydrolase)
MNLKEFQTLAMRTESIVDEVECNKLLLSTVLEQFVVVSELLDCLKKQIYYNDSSKLEKMKGTLTSKMAYNSNTLCLLATDKDLEINTIDINSRILHGIIGNGSEAGELVSALLIALNGGELDAVNIAEELADSSWYHAPIYDELGIDWDTSLGQVIEKLRIRFPDKYSDAHAKNRDLDSERKALNKVES